MSVTPAVPPRDVDPITRTEAAKRATYIAFAGAGFAFASWASRIPQVRDELRLDPSTLGLVLLAIAAGSILALPLGGPLVTRFGSRRVVSSMASLLGVAMLVVAVGTASSVWVVAVGLFLLGLANGAWDVAMNVQAAVVERLLRKSIMSRFHAGFSLGTVAGALVGAGMVALGVPVSAHLVGVAVVTTAAVVVAVRAFVSDVGEDPAGEPGERRSVLAAWKEPRTLVVGVFVLAFAFAEGSGNDWISVAVIDDYGAPAAIGTLAFAVFLAAMTTGRWFGPALLDRFGRVRVLQTLVVLALAGSLLFVFGTSTPVAFAGVLLWGLGTSLGFPVGMSAAADDPRHAASRVSVVASIGYCAFLAGPPLIGFVGDHSTITRALIAAPVLLAIAGLLATWTREPARPAPVTTPV